MHCDTLWTGGFVVAVSGNRDNWMWNMSTHTKKAEYLAWGDGEPNNSGGLGEDAIMRLIKIIITISV